MPHTPMRPFHFWCQKVLPLVFDDSLSYYEVLAKMRDYLNTAIEEINAIGDEYEGITNRLEELKTYVDEYFAELDVNQAISDKLDNMVESGEMDAVITPIFAAYANPLFAASVADMMATNFAYTNYENNKIYTFNQSTGLYQTTGKEFGGVVSSVDEMEDNDKYYALDSDGMLYSYDFPEATFVATGLTYGGYRYGVNAMRPISNVYVLTTDSHVYTWNGSEYVDSGVVYGLNNTAFIWRRELSSADNITLLVTDGWYYFKSDSLPMGLPVNMETSDGFAVVYSIPNDTDNSDNVRSEAAQDVQTQRTQNIRANSRNKRIILNTAFGGAWFWDGTTWISNSQNGFPVCVNCDNVTWNSVLTCNENTASSPIRLNGTLITSSTNDHETSQLFFTSERMWFRHSNGEWLELATKIDYNNNLEKINALEEYTHWFSEYQFYTRLLLQQSLANLETKLAYDESVLMTIRPIELRAQTNLTIATNNNDAIMGESFVAKTDSSLTQDDVPAEAKATGEAINALNKRIDKTETAISVESEARAIGDEKVIAYANNLFNAVTEIAYLPAVTENNDVILTEQNNAITFNKLVQRTDSTLTQDNVAANAATVGGKFVDEKQARLVRDTALSNAILRVESLQKTTSDRLTTIANSIITTITNEIITENNKTLCAQNGVAIGSLALVVKTDSALDDESLPANAKSVGDEMRKLNNAISDAWCEPYDYSVTSGVGVTKTAPVIWLYGSLPTTKTNVDCYVVMPNYSGHCKLKVQGSSSIYNPEKNYTITLDTAIRFEGITSNKWNLKCNYIDSTQALNSMGAWLWREAINQLYPTIVSNVIANNNGTITTENANTITCNTFTRQIQKQQNCGCSIHYPCIVYHENAFHGVYTMGIGKGYKMLNMSGQNNVIIAVDNWGFKPFESMDDFLSRCDIEEIGNNVSLETVYDSLNDIARICALDYEQFLEQINTRMFLDEWRYYCAFCVLLNHWDGVARNFILYSTDGGNKYHITVWDMDCILGNYFTGVQILPPKASTNLRRNTLFKQLLDNEDMSALSTTLSSTCFSINNMYDFLSYFQTPLHQYLLQRDIIKWNAKPNTSMTVFDRVNWYQQRMLTNYPLT